MSGTALLIDIGGAVALLLWAVRMIRTGITRTLGGRIHQLVSHVAGNRVRGFANGLLATLCVQSSMAVALILSSLASRGAIELVPGLAVMLGADVGSTLVVQVLAFDVHWLAPVALIAGVGLFMSTAGGMRRHVGRFVIGIGLLLLALSILKGASAPLRDASGSLAPVLGLIGGEPVIAMLLAMLLTWLAHSSLAVVLFVMALTAEGVIGIEAALPLVLGANLGSALAPVVTTWAGKPAGRRIPIGNLGMRAVAAIVVLPFLDPAANLLGAIDSSPARQIAHFHTGFNLLLALCMLPLLEPVARLLCKLVPDLDRTEDPALPRHLDAEALDHPAEALASASREALRMGDAAQAMLEAGLPILSDYDTRLLARIKADEMVLDGLHRSIKLYLTRLSGEELDAAESRRYVELLALVTNLEHIGDIIDHNLLELAEKRSRNAIIFSAEELADITLVHENVLGDLKLAMGVFMTRDLRLARQLVDRKGDLRTLEREASEAQLQRAGAGDRHPLLAIGLHLDIIRDLKRIHSHVAAIAYPLLEAEGELATTRLLGKMAGRRGPAAT